MVRSSKCSSLFFMGSFVQRSVGRVEINHSKAPRLFAKVQMLRCFATLWNACENIKVGHTHHRNAKFNKSDLVACLAWTLTKAYLDHSFSFFQVNYQGCRDCCRRFYLSLFFFGQLEWLLLDSQYALLELMMAEKPMNGAWVAQRCRFLSAMIRSCSIPRESKLLALQEKVNCSPVNRSEISVLVFFINYHEYLTLYVSSRKRTTAYIWIGVRSYSSIFASVTSFRCIYNSTNGVVYSEERLGVLVVFRSTGAHREFFLEEDTCR